MKGDFTRDSFDPLKSFSRVLMQQGRVQLDSDWNEQASLTLAYVRTLARDLLGEGAGPERDCGFRIAALGDLERIGDAGRFTSIEKALLEANRSALEDGDLLLLPGRYYVGGIPVELRQAMLYRAQPGYPFNEASPTGLPAGPGEGSIAYLDVWEDFVSAVEDEALRDPALGGVDTCGRGVVRWQVRILQGGIQEFEALSSSSPGRLSASGAYSGLENHLYRVEIHRGSDSDGSGATFKWSRDNGSVAWRIEEIVGKWVRLARSARDEPSPLAPGNWVELSCDCLRGHDPEGVLGRVAEVSPEDGSLIVEWAGSAPVPTLPIEALRPVLRRWDHAGLVEVGGAIAVEPGVEIDVENGIVLRFEQGGRFRAGDYWLIPARPSIGDILWPGAPDCAQAQPPHGLEHHYAPLASLRDGATSDLRRTFGSVSVGQGSGTDQ